MMYRLSNGYSVSTDEMGPKTEFTTVNPDGEIVSTVCVGGLEAMELKRGLCVAIRLAML